MKVKLFGSRKDNIDLRKSVLLEVFICRYSDNLIVLMLVISSNCLTDKEDTVFERDTCSPDSWLLLWMERAGAQGTDAEASALDAPFNDNERKLTENMMAIIDNRILLERIGSSRSALRKPPESTAGLTESTQKGKFRNESGGTLL